MATLRIVLSRPITSRLMHSTTKVIQRWSNTSSGWRRRSRMQTSFSGYGTAPYRVGHCTTHRGRRARGCARPPRPPYGAPMIVVTGKVETTAAQRDELMRVAQAMCAASRSDTGCLGYRLYEDTERPNSFVILEEWESE